MNNKLIYGDGEYGIRNEDSSHHMLNKSILENTKDRYFLNSYLNNDNDNVIQIQDVPIYIKYYSISSNCTSTAPSTPNSREYSHIDNNRPNSTNNDSIGINSAINQFKGLNENFNNRNINVSGYLKNGLFDISQVNVQLFNFKIIKKRKFSNSNTLLKTDSKVYVEMTKPNDFSFLLNFNISDGNDFLYLKSEQRLLVDFQEFPVMLVDLLNRSKYRNLDQITKSYKLNSLNKNSENRTVFPGIDRIETGINCSSDATIGLNNDNGNLLKIILNVQILDTGTESNFGILGRTFNSNILNNFDSCILHFVEFNHYKEIVHLSLPFESANESFFREYILTHLNFYYDLSRKNQDIINNYEIEIETLKKEIVFLNEKLGKTNYLSIQHERELAERFDIETRKLTEKYELDYNNLKLIYDNARQKDLEQWNFERINKENKINNLQLKFNELGNLFNELNESKSDLEKYAKHNQEENVTLKSKLESIENSYNVLSNIKNELELELNELKLEYNKKLELNNSLKSELDKKQKEINDLDVALDDACKEIEKGNHIISSLQNSLLNVDNKYKQQMTIFNNLKRSYQEIELKNKDVSEKLTDYEQLLDDSNNRQEQLLEENDRLRKILLEAEKQIEINQNVISSLKKQISMNESALYNSYVDYYSPNYGNITKNYKDNIREISNGVHYTLGNLPQSIASISASRISSTYSNLINSNYAYRQRKRPEMTLDANSLTRKYSMSVQPRRSYTWTLENTNHEPKDIVPNSEKKGKRYSLSKKNIENDSQYIDENKKNSIDKNDKSSLFTPPNNRIKIGTNDSNKEIKYNIKDHRKKEIGCAPVDDYLYALNESESENFENTTKELTTPRLKTPVKPTRSEHIPIS